MFVFCNTTHCVSRYCLALFTSSCAKWGSENQLKKMLTLRLLLLLWAINHPWFWPGTLVSSTSLHSCKHGRVNAHTYTAMFQTWGNWSPEKGSEWPEVTAWMRSSTRTRSHMFLMPSPVLIPCLQAASRDPSRPLKALRILPCFPMGLLHTLCALPFTLHLKVWLTTPVLFSFSAGHWYT